MVLNWVSQTPNPKPQNPDEPKQLIYYHSTLKGCQIAYIGSAIYTIAHVYKTRGLKPRILSTFTQSLKKSTLLGITVSDIYAYYKVNTSPELNYQRAVQLHKNEAQNRIDDFMLIGWCFGIFVRSMLLKKVNFLDCMFFGGFLGCAGFYVNEKGLGYFGWNFDSELLM